MSVTKYTVTYQVGVNIIGMPIYITHKLPQEKKPFPIPRSRK